MKIKGIVDEDFVNYSLAAMFIAFPNCSFKCDKECGSKVCQNSKLAHEPTLEITKEEIVNRFMNNPITEAVVFGGLEPFDSFADMYELIKKFRKKTSADIVIYTGYTETEKYNEVYEVLAKFPNIYIKFGRYIPNIPTRHDEVLGITLSSENQYGVKIS